MAHTWVLALLMAGAVRLDAANSPEQMLGRCKVTWNTPSRDAFDSMPLSGTRGSGANVWFSEGALNFYLAHNGAYDADEVLRKIGALTVKVPGLELTKLKSFRQELDPATGSIRIEITAEDGTTLSYLLQFASESLIIDCKTSRKLSLEVAYGNWRIKPLPSSSDSVEVLDGVLVYTHRNGETKRANDLAKQQNVSGVAFVNPVENRIFGCAIAARGGMQWAPAQKAKSPNWDGYEWAGVLPEATRQLIVVTLAAGKKSDPDEWVDRSKLLLEDDALAAVRSTNELRWQEFWQRSYIFVQPKADSVDEAFQIGRNYQLFRYMLACNQGGELPLKFNGGIFTVEAHGDRIPQRLNNSELGKPPTGRDPDYRRWDQMFMAQNQRWLGWPTIASGDMDLTAPSLLFYRDRTETARTRARNLKAYGAVYHEYQSLGGMVYDAGTPEGLCKHPHLTYHFSMGLEHAWMAMQSSLVNGQNIQEHKSWILAQLRFFDKFYRDAAKSRTGKEFSSDNRLIIYPANGLELTGGATNPIETVAALRAITAGMLNYGQLDAAERKFVSEFQTHLPELPTLQRNGFTILAPAKSWENLFNGWELPELYPAWPYRLLGVTQPSTLTLARTTWNLLDEPRGNNRSGVCHKLDFSWQPTLVDAAALGWPQEAGKRAIAKLSDRASPCRFPAFFGPGHDWVPDHNWGGSGSVGLQEMLLAAEPDAKGKIYLLAAWPKDWDVSFRLRAPGKTLITCDIEGGKIMRLEVSPLSRRSDIVLPEGWSLPSQ